MDEPLPRCAWVSNELNRRYHDEEWGVPLHDDRALFEFLILEGMQAGLSWDTILRKREAFREAFDGFDPETVAAYSPEKIASLMENPEIIRNRQKIQAAIGNAQAFLLVREEHGSFDAYIWGLAGGEPRRNQWTSHDQVPAGTPESVAMSKDLRRRGFRFVGPTICYALMQATGMVNDHTIECFRHAEIEALRQGPAS
jgi:DNA-3-methyladenine glycosylase I